MLQMEPSWFKNVMALNGRWFKCPRHCERGWKMRKMSCDVERNSPAWFGSIREGRGTRVTHFQAGFLELHFRGGPVFFSTFSFTCSQEEKHSPAISQVTMGFVLLYMRSNTGRGGFGLRQAGMECQLQDFNVLPHRTPPCAVPVSKPSMSVIKQAYQQTEGLFYFTSFTCLLLTTRF